MGKEDGFERTVGALVLRASLGPLCGEVLSETAAFLEGLWGVVLLGRGSRQEGGERVLGGGGVTALVWAWHRRGDVFLLSLTTKVL